jgi:starvation-inducible DNA-binding protein
MNDAAETTARRTADLAALTHLSADALRDVSAALTMLLADMFAVYLKTRSFHWHISGPHFRDYHVLLGEQSSQILGATDAVAKRVRKIGGTTIHSVSHISRLQRIPDNDTTHVAPQDMLAELLDDNRELARHLRMLHGLCNDLGDVATASFAENWIEEAESRTWFLFEATRAPPSG